MTTDSPPGNGLRLGELLLKASRLSADLLEESVQQSSQMGLLLGEVLVARGVITRVELRRAIVVQSALRDRCIDLETAIGSLASGTATQQVFAARMACSAAKKKTNRLGELLVEAGIVAEDRLAEALAKSEATGIPLGKTLIAMAIVKEATVNSVLLLQEQIRRGSVDRCQAVARLREVARSTLEKSSLSKIRLGQILILSRLATKAEVARVLATATSENKLLGASAVSMGLISNENLQDALYVQQLAASKRLSAFRACRLLAYANDSGVSVRSVIKDYRERSEVRRSPRVGVDRKMQPDENYACYDTAYQHVRSSYIALWRQFKRVGMHGEMVAVSQQIVRLHERLSRPRHSTLIEDFACLSNSYFFACRFEEAKQAIKRAIEVYETAGQFDAWREACLFNVLGTICLYTLEHADADAALSRAITLMEITVAQDHPQLVVTLQKYAELSNGQRRQEGIGTPGPALAQVS